MLCLWVAVLTGCPEPVDELPATGDGATIGRIPGPPPGDISSPPLDGGAPSSGGGGTAPTATPGAPPSNTNMGAPGGSMNASAAPPHLGTFAGDLSDAELKPAYSQSDLADGAVIRGTLVCDTCTGQLLVRVLPPPPDNPTASSRDSLQLITQAPFATAGTFEIRVPSGEPVILQVVDDADMSGFPSQGERMGMRAEGPIISEEEETGIILTVGVFPAMVDITPSTVLTPGDMPTPGGTPSAQPPTGEVSQNAEAPPLDGTPSDMLPPPDTQPPPESSGADGPPADDGGPPADDG